MLAAMNGPRILALALLVASPASAQLVTRVIDGDTIVVENVGTVRLIGVNTAETLHPRRPVEFFGREASAFTRQLVLGRVVRLERDFQLKDTHERTLAYVYLPDGTFVNAEIVKQGYGHAYVQYPFRFLDQFRTYEREARQGGRGLWGFGNPASAGPSARPADKSADPELIVYVTRTGTKYHQAGCRYLARSRIPMALKNVGSYGPCSVCSPPVLRQRQQGCLSSHTPLPDQMQALLNPAAGRQLVNVEHDAAAEHRQVVSIAGSTDSGQSVRVQDEDHVYSRAELKRESGK